MKKLFTVLVVFIVAVNCNDEVDQKKQPNIIYFLADDLGFGEVGIYGQQKIQTPRARQACAPVCRARHRAAARLVGVSGTSGVWGVKVGYMKERTERTFFRVIRRLRAFC